MRDQWYGDNRDLVKWGVLLELSRNFARPHILQVLYLRPSEWGNLEIDGEIRPLPKEVRQHFRSVKAIQQMTSEVQIELIHEEFRDRNLYLDQVKERIRSRQIHPGVVFLDPDTGLEPAGHAGLQHVFNRELTAIWGALTPGDVLVFYQHKTNRNQEPWIKPKLGQFESAINADAGENNRIRGKLAYAPDVANDVAFFFATKL